MQPVNIEDLKNVIALSDLPDEHLQWILDHSEYHEYTDGDLIGKYGEPAEIMWFSLVGKVAFYMYLNGRQVYYFTFENNNVTGGVGGLMPYSRMKTYPGYSYALGEVKMLRMNKKYFTELEQLNPDFHLLFLLSFARYLGFAPHNNRNELDKYFEMQEGVFKLNIENLKSGNYIVNVSSTTANYTTKFIKL